MLNSALKFTQSDLSVIPIRQGSKKAKVEWKEYQSRIANEAELQAMFSEGDWFAVVTGAVSKNLEVMDFDIPGKSKLTEKGSPPHWEPFCEIVRDHGFGDLLDKMVRVETASGGMHLFYRVEELIGGNQKLSMLKQEGKREVAIETRGEGGYVLTFPTPGYKMIGGRFSSIPVLTAEEHEFFLNAARMLTEEPRETYSPEKGNASASRPGDDYNARADFRALLEAHGWKRGGRAGKREAWVRPGKNTRDGMSATLTQDGGVFYVFSSNAEPFQPDVAYTPFSAYALLEHKGDFFFAAQQLGEQGFGRPKAPKLNDRNSSTIKTKKIGLSVRTIGEDHKPVVLEYLVRPYLPKGKCILLDADGGVGKTSLALAFAAALSQGRLPITHEACEPVKTLYLHKGEDSDEELETVYRACGGVTGMIFYADVPFDEDGLELLEEYISENQIGLVVVDALMYFLQGVLEDSNVAMDVQAIIQQLNNIASKTGVTFWNLRHTTKGRVGKSASELGMGSVAFRNSHRGQLVARFHPDEKGLVIVTDEKGRLLGKSGPHFAYRRRDNAVEWVRNCNNPFDMAADSKLDKCVDWLAAYCAGQYIPNAQLAEAAKAMGYSGATLRRAKEDLKDRGELEYKRFESDGPWYVKTTKEEVYDPYNDLD